MGLKVIFLDFDGVLNSLSGPSEGVSLLPDKLELLHQLVDATDAEIVLSTSWREHWAKEPTQSDGTGEQIDQLFKAHGLRIFDKTPSLPTGREAEIRAWLDQHPQVKTFVVLDDRLLGAEYLKGHFVKVSRYFGGLSELDIHNATDILKEAVAID